ncbi:alpha/beta hydrolase [Bacteroidota bacterium]
MKKTVIQLLLCMLPVMTIAQTGKVYDNLSLKSEILKMERKYAIYLPPDYESSMRSYPVLYLLHGGGDDQTGWVQFGEVLHIADKAILEGKSTAMVIVMPDANTGQRGFNNDVSGEWLYEDFFFEEFMPHVEKTYRIKGEKQYRAVAGLSMGGGGTYYYALHRPNLFAAACPLSAGGGRNTKEGINNRRKERGLPVWPEDKLDEWIKKYSILDLIEDMPEENIKAVRWYIDSGDDDRRASEGSALVHAAMNKKGIPHEFRIRDGAHNWTYWRTALPEVLDFISQRFHR